MFSQSLLALAASFAAAEAATKGFNYGSTDTSGAPLTEAQFAALFTRAQNLQGTSGFNSARLYTMIQGDTTNSPIEAISAAISTNTQLLLGMWASAGQSDFDNEIAALTSAISTYGSKFTDLVTGLSVGSEDLYRDSVTGVENNDGVGVGPEVLVSYISQVKSALANTALSGLSIGHVDTWDAWTNGSNSAVISAVDWLGVDSYPYFETTVANAIGSQAKTAFFNSYDATEGVAGGKPVWITETGWPVSGPTSGQAVASVANAETYWQDVGCEILGNINTWWYTLEDAMPTTPSPSFGIIGSDLSAAPMYDLTCNKTTSATTSSSSTSTASKTGAATTTTSSAKSGHSGASTTLSTGTQTVVNGTHQASTTGSAVMSTGTSFANGTTTTSASTGTVISTGTALSTGTANWTGASTTYSNSPTSTSTSVPLNAGHKVGASSVVAALIGIAGFLAAN